MPGASTAPLPFRRWAVTGGTGLVGNNLVRALVAQGAEVRVLARKPPRREFEGLDIEQIDGEIDDTGALTRLFAGAECVVHSAAIVDVRYGRRAEFERVNVGGTAAVLAALPAGARLVHVSTVDALGLGTRERPGTEDSAPQASEGGVPYVDTKRAADRLVLGSAADAVIVYPTYMVGPWDWKPSSGRMILEIARGKGLLAPAGGNNFVDVRDVVEGLIAAAGRPRGGRWILGNANLSYREMWTTIAAVTGAKAPAGELPAWIGRVAAGALSAATALGLPEGDINAATTAMSFLPHYFDPSRARAELALPASPLRNAVEAAWDWFVARGYAQPKGGGSRSNAAG
jgi:dihydroflavonol-4-reductase